MPEPLSANAFHRLIYRWIEPGMAGGSRRGGVCSGQLGVAVVINARLLGGFFRCQSMGV